MSTPAPTPVSYADFLAAAQESDVRVLSLLAAGETPKTQDPAEKDEFEQLGNRLFDAGLLARFRVSREVISNEVWFVVDGRVHPTAVVMVAKCAMERLQLSRAPVPVGET